MGKNKTLERQNTAPVSPVEHTRWLQEQVASEHAARRARLQVELARRIQLLGELAA